jgi:CubicO group peptidase (beta-lactamase class C family)
VVVLVAGGILVAGCAVGEEVEPASRPSVSSPTVVTTPADDTADRIRRIVDAELPGLSGAVLVAVDGEPVAEWASGVDAATDQPLTPSSRFRLGSITKQFTAAAVMLLADRGEVDPADSVCQHLPDCPSAWQPITIEMAVAHTTGIPEYTELPTFDPMTADTGAPAQLLEALRGLPLEREPGSNFAYNNSGYAVLGAIIESVSGRTYEEFLRSEVLDPLQMADTGYDSGDDGVVGGWATPGVPAADIDMTWPYSAGGMYSTVRDLATWHAALATGDLWSADARARLLEPIETITDVGGLAYAWGKYVGDLRGHTIAAHGGSIDGFSTSFLRTADRAVTVAILTNREDSGDIEASALGIARLVLSD